MDRHMLVFLLTAALSAGLLTAHFLIVAFSLTPDNPLKREHREWVQAYMDPVFSQNWKLFAPNPVSQHRSLSAQARVVHPQTGKVVETEWIDLTTPLNEQKQENRLFPEARLSRYIISGIRQYQGREEDEQQRGEWILQRTASTALNQRWPDREISEIRFRVITHTFPRFDQRHQADDTTQRDFRESEWLPFAPADIQEVPEWASP